MSFRCATIASAPAARASACFAAARAAMSAVFSVSTSSGRASDSIVTNLWNHDSWRLTPPNHRESKAIRSASTFRSERVLRVPPIDPVEHIGQLRRRNRNHPFYWRRPDELPALKPLGVERHPQPVVPDNFNQVATPYVIQHTNRNLLSWNIPGTRCMASGSESTRGTGGADARFYTSRLSPGSHENCRHGWLTAQFVRRSRPARLK